MKLIFNGDKIILYLNNLYVCNVDFNDKQVINKYINDLLHKLEKDYNLSFNGYYSIVLYLDKNYGVIIEMIDEDSLYVDYFGNALDINMKVYKDSFLYEVSDVDISDDYDIYICNNHIYVSFKNSVSDEFMGQFMENVNDIIYGEKKKNILGSRKILG